MAGEAEYLRLNSPDRAQHLWRYTPWHRIHPSGDVAQLPQEVAPTLVELSLLDGSEIPHGVTISASDEKVFRDVTDDVAAAFIRCLPNPSSMTIKISDGVVLSQPLLLSISSNGAVGGIEISIEVGSNSEAELVTSLEGDAEWFGLLRNTTVNPSARFTDVVINRTKGGKLLRVEQVNLDTHTNVKLGTLNTGGERCKTDLRCNLLGRGGSLTVNGSVVSSDNQHNDHHIEIEHLAPDTYSRLNWHSACNDRSRTIGTGMLRIAQGAKGSDSAQVFNNLLLSRNAEADSIPELEVLEHEVVGCGHGTANGPVDEEQMFYLKSRGFSDSEAQAMLVSAFLNSTLKEMGSEQIHATLREIMNV